MVKFLRVLVHLHLPESGGEIKCGKNGRVGPADVPDAFGNFLHGILVNVGVLVELSEILNDPETLALFLGNAENG